MNRIMQQHKGFSVVEILLVVIVLAIIGLLGWRFYASQSAESTTKEDSSLEQTQVPTVDNPSDLQEVEEIVNSTDIDTALDTTEIDETLE